MKITMLRSKMGSNDGTTTKMYEKGEEYDVSESLAQSFIDEQVAEEVGAATEPASQPTFIDGDLYHDEHDNLFVGAVVPGKNEVGLFPIEQLADEERTKLIEEGKLSADGTAVASKAIETAPKNKAIGKAPKNKAK